MSLTLHSYMRYLNGKHSPFTPPFYETNKLVKALKGEDINGYVRIQVGGKQVDLRTDNKELVYRWFAERVAELGLNVHSNWSVISLPDSGCTIASKVPSKVAKLASAIEARLPFLKQVDALRFKKAMPKSHENENMRDPQMLFAAMQLVAVPPPGSRVLLLDDVCTSGGHMAAAAAHLKRAGSREVIALCAARTNYSNEDKAQGWETQQIEELNP